MNKLKVGVRFYMFIFAAITMGFGAGIIFEGVAGWRMLLDQGLFFIGSVYTYVVGMGIVILYEGSRFISDVVSCFEKDIEGDHHDEVN